MGLKTLNCNRLRFTRGGWRAPSALVEPGTTLPLWRYINILLSECYCVEVCGKPTNVIHKVSNIVAIMSGNHSMPPGLCFGNTMHESLQPQVV